MGSFTSSISDLEVVGPNASLMVSIASAAEQTFRDNNRPIPDPVSISAMIDTGAAVSVIQKGIAAQLDIHPVGFNHVTTPTSANVKCPVYAVRFTFPGTGWLNVNVIEAPLQDPTIQGLIGRDVLKHAVFVYLGKANQFTLSF